MRNFIFCVFVAFAILFMVAGQHVYTTYQRAEDAEGTRKRRGAVSCYMFGSFLAIVTLLVRVLAG